MMTYEWDDRISECQDAGRGLPYESKRYVIILDHRPKAGRLEVYTDEHGTFRYRVKTSEMITSIPPPIGLGSGSVSFFFGLDDLGTLVWLAGCPSNSASARWLAPE